MRQLIIARKDLHMSPGKLAAQVAHASWAFMSHGIRKHAKSTFFNATDNKYYYELKIDKDIVDDWFCTVFTKIVCEAPDKEQLLRAKEIAEGLGMVENKDFFLIRDVCLTELTPEEVDENGVGRTLTCIGFKPLDDETAWKISKTFKLYS